MAFRDKKMIGNENTTYQEGGMAVDNTGQGAINEDQMKQLIQMIISLPLAVKQQLLQFLQQSIQQAQQGGGQTETAVQGEPAQPTQTMKKGGQIRGKAKSPTYDEWYNIRYGIIPKTK
jgi:hypothetical protein